MPDDEFAQNTSKPTHRDYMHHNIPVLRTLDLRQNNKTTKNSIVVAIVLI